MNPVGLNSHEMTELWFGDTDVAVLLQADYDFSTPEDVVSAYFSIREADFTGTINSISAKSVPISAKVRREMRQRTKGIANYQKELNLAITDAEVTAKFEKSQIIQNKDGTVTLYAYEWTFVDYEQEIDSVIWRDIFGFGTDHKIVLSMNGSQYMIMSDEYDEADLFSVCTVSDATQVELGWGENTIFPETGDDEDIANLLGGYTYNVAAAVAYADKYAKSYNPSYVKHTNNDCANFVSQCIYAGGIPKDTVWKPESMAWINTHRLLVSVVCKGV